jgi:hypothetical protein
MPFSGAPRSAAGSAKNGGDSVLFQNVMRLTCCSCSVWRQRDQPVRPKSSVLFVPLAGRQTLWTGELVTQPSPGVK